MRKALAVSVIVGLIAASPVLAAPMPGPTTYGAKATLKPLPGPTTYKPGSFGSPGAKTQ